MPRDSLTYLNVAPKFSMMSISSFRFRNITIETQFSGYRMKYQ